MSGALTKVAHRGATEVLDSQFAYIDVEHCKFLNDRWLRCWSKVKTFTHEEHLVVTGKHLVKTNWVHSKTLDYNYLTFS